jgi:hypothetical protein
MANPTDPIRTGPTFIDELKAAGLDPATTPLVWDFHTGEISPSSVLTKEQRKIFAEVLAAHGTDPASATSKPRRRST